jgi:hypothetical protein
MNLMVLQASKTYLEMHVDSFSGLPRDSLILQGLLSLKASLQSGELDASNCTVAVVGKDQVSLLPSYYFFLFVVGFHPTVLQPFKIYDGAAVQPFIDSLDALEMEVCCLLRFAISLNSFAFQRGGAGNAMDQ